MTKLLKSFKWRFFALEKSLFLKGGNTHEICYELDTCPLIKLTHFISSVEHSPFEDEKNDRFQCQPF